MPEGAAMTDVELSIVIPCYNEAAGIETVWSRLTGAVVPLGLAWEAIFVNDGSTDATLEAISRLPAETGAVQIIDFSRNFGKEAAITAGLDHARGAAVIIIDADLQHPPEVIPEMVRLWRQGTEVVLCKRESRDMDSPLRAFLSGLFYKLSSQLFEVKIPATSAISACWTGPLSMRFPGGEESALHEGPFAWIGFRSEPSNSSRSDSGRHGRRSSHLETAELRRGWLTSFTTVPLQAVVLYRHGAVAARHRLWRGHHFQRHFLRQTGARYTSIVALVTSWAAAIDRRRHPRRICRPDLQGGEVPAPLRHPQSVRERAEPCAPWSRRPRTIVNS